MSGLSDISTEVIQNNLFPHLHAAERGRFEQTNKRFCILSRDYLFKELKKRFGIESENFSKFYSSNAQETIRILYIYLHRCSKVFDDSEMQTILQAIYNKKGEFIEETLIVCQEIKINLLKIKIREKVELFLNDIAQFTNRWIPDCLSIAGKDLILLAHFLGAAYLIVALLALGGPSSASALAIVVPAILFYIILSLPILFYVKLEFLIEKVKLSHEYSELKQLKTLLQSKCTNAALINTSSTFFRQSDESSGTCDSQLSSGQINQAFQM